MKVREVFKRLEADGWYEARMRGSHRVLKHPQKSGIVVVSGNCSVKLPLELSKVSGNKRKWRTNYERICCHF
ncbi:MAG: type II toxin-antitoxin system HicA family toxin [Scytonema sp. PMC 1069.18]|nr:type II toxin-antitoxin system HicA family toxin [Scytonema sp. PMC 1069.18]MEC4882761.1 type II toxin-antitoxin system HicA family toxin [Scytonema sp. PMC 1070.18]